MIKKLSKPFIILIIFFLGFFLGGISVVTYMWVTNPDDDGVGVVTNCLCPEEINAIISNGIDAEISHDVYVSLGEDFKTEYLRNIPEAASLDESTIQGKYGGKISLLALKKLVCNSNPAFPNQLIDFKFGFKNNGGIITSTYLMFDTPGYTGGDGVLHQPLSIRTGESPESFCPSMCPAN